MYQGTFCPWHSANKPRLKETLPKDQYTIRESNILMPRSKVELPRNHQYVCIGSNISVVLCGDVVLYSLINPGYRGMIGYTTMYVIL